MILLHVGVSVMLLLCFSHPFFPYPPHPTLPFSFFVLPSCCVPSNLSSGTFVCCLPHQHANGRYVGTVHEYCTSPKVLDVETMCLAWCGLGAEMNIDDDTCKLVERIRALPAVPELVVIMLKHGAEWAANELTRGGVAKAVIWCRVDGLESAQALLIRM